MKKSEDKLNQILGRNKPLKFRLIDFYLDRPVFSDFLISSIIVISHYYFSRKIHSFFFFESSSLTDILNELISTSLATGGFVLAALAIIAGIKDRVVELKPTEKPKNGKEYFFNSIGYKNVLRMYSISCIIYLLAFIYFTFLRGSYSSFDGEILLALVLLGFLIIPN